MTDIIINNRIGRCGKKRVLNLDVDDLTERKRLYAQVKNKEIIHCEACCCNVSYYGKAAHDKTKKHLSNLKYLNLLNSKNI